MLSIGSGEDDTIGVLGVVVFCVVCLFVCYYYYFGSFFLKSKGSCH